MVPLSSSGQILDPLFENRRQRCRRQRCRRRKVTDSSSKKPEEDSTNFDFDPPFCRGSHLRRRCNSR